VSTVSDGTASTPFDGPLATVGPFVPELTLAEGLIPKLDYTDRRLGFFPEVDDNVDGTPGDLGRRRPALEDFTVRPPRSGWIPSASRDAPLLTDQVGFFFNERPLADFGVMENFLDRARPFTQEVGQYYNVHPAAIALAVYNESQYNMTGWLSDYGQYGLYAAGDLAGKDWLLGKGLGFGSMHTDEVSSLYPAWTPRQTVIARMNYEYAAPLIAADMDLKASMYEQITGISIRNDPAMLTWAFNTSARNVFDSANAKADLFRGGATSVEFDIYQNTQLGGMGMAWWSQENVSRFPSFAPLSPLPNSPVPYRFPARPPAPAYPTYNENFVGP
jgi:hypothetical protein